METGGAAVRAADIPRASLTVVLVDSTGYGWLPGQKLGDAAMDFRKCGGVETVASIVSGGSIVKAGKKDGTNILDQFMQWVLDGGEETHGGDVEVEVGVVPARDSVQGARYEALGVARLACGVPELSKSILEIVPGAYGGSKKALHFLPACASESMERVVEAARAELEVRRAERRSAGAEGAPASERRSTGGSGAWVAVVICAGWNCNEVENLQEAFVVKQLCETQTWSEFLWACSAHSSKKRAWAKTAQALDLAPPKLFQTNREDHPQAAANKAQFAQGLERHFVGDAECVDDIKSLGGSALLARYESFQQPAHRADLSRYIRLWKEGGSYLDIKMALLQPWSTTLQEIYAEGERCLEGQRVAQSSGQRVAPPTEVRDLSQVPHLLLSIGQNRKHIFQGNIWHASAKHPLLARAVGHALGTMRISCQSISYRRNRAQLRQRQERRSRQLPALPVMTHRYFYTRRIFFEPVSYQKKARGQLRLWPERRSCQLPTPPVMPRRYLATVQTFVPAYFVLPEQNQSSILFRATPLRQQRLNDSERKEKRSECAFPCAFSCECGMQLSCAVRFRVFLARATHCTPRRSKPETDKQLQTKRARTEVCAGPGTWGIPAVL